MLLTKEVSKILKINYATLLKYIKKGYVKAYRCGGDWRIHKGDLLSFIEHNQVMFGGLKV